MPLGTVFNFEWRVARSGYMWAVGVPTGTRISRGGVIMPSGYTSQWEGELPDAPYPFLVTREQFLFPPKEDPVELQRQFDAGEPSAIGIQDAQGYEPLEQLPSLFLEFAATRNSFSAQLRFANQFGSLGGDMQAQFTVEHEGQTLYLWGEPLGWRLDALAFMRLAIEILALVKEKSADELADLVVWDTDGSLNLNFPDLENSEDYDAPSPFPHDEFEERQHLEGNRGLDHFWREAIEQDLDFWHEWDGAAIIGAPGYRSERIREVKRVGPSAAINFVASDLINGGLRGRASPLVRWSAEELRHHLLLAPHSLLGALWLQLALAADQERSFRQCAVCGTFFEIAPGRGRPEKTFCSDACRMRAYRSRKARQETGNAAVR